MLSFLPSTSVTTHAFSFPNPHKLHVVVRTSRRRFASRACVAMARACRLDCVHFATCDGCTHETNLEAPPASERAARFFHDVDVGGGKLAPWTLQTPKTHAWRCRARLVATRDDGGRVELGLYRRGTHDVVDIPECRAHHPRLNEAAAMLRRLVQGLRVSVHDEDRKVGKLRHVQLAVCTSDTSLPKHQRYDKGRVQVTLVWHAKSYEAMAPAERKELHRLCAYIWREGRPGQDKTVQELIHSVWVNFNAADTNVVLGPKWKRMEGPAWMWERLGGAEVCFHPGSFSQANLTAFDLALKAIHNQVPKGARVAEFYAGVGAIGVSLAASRNCAVDMIEVNPHVREPFNQTKARLPPETRDRLHMNIVSADEMPERFLANADVVVVDPPRKGLDPGLMNALNSEQSKKVQKIIYLSCGYDALERDVLQLLQVGDWDVAHAEAFNFFPGTDSIETLVILQRKASNPPPPKKSKQNKSKKKAKRKNKATGTSAASQT